MKRLVAVLATVLLHSALLAFALTSCPAKTQAASPQQEEREEHETVRMRLIESEDGSNGTPCPDTYRGIGIGRFAELVTEVLPGGPADRAGIQLGDVILNMRDLERDRYPVGHRLELHIQRDDAELRVEVVIGPVCFAQDRSTQ